MLKSILSCFAITTVIVLTILGSSAVDAAPALTTQTTLPAQTSPSPETTPPTDSTLGEDWSSFDYARYRFEGIPQPRWDSSVDGWIQYLGDGHFISEFGVEFFWRDGRFVYADGTVMGLPPSATAHLNSLGVYRQPTAEDWTGTLSKSADNEAQFRQPGTVSRSVSPRRVEGSLAAAAWPGTYLHVGRNTTYWKTFWGTKADVWVHNSSPWFQQYQGIGLKHDSTYRIGFQYASWYPADPADTYWTPGVHGWINNTPVEYYYDQKAIHTYGESSQTHNLKLSVKQNGYIYPYVDDGLSVDPDHIQWDPTYSGYVESAFELGSDDAQHTPHDPANHHSNIKVQRVRGTTTWDPLTNDISPVSMYNKIELNGSVFADGLYNYLWYINPNYNWMAHPL